MSAIAQLAVLLLVLILAIAVVLLIPAATIDRPYETNELDDAADDHEESSKDRHRE